ncbi:RNB domain-containing protein [Cephalotus follicularis]|uniref:DIS3-like exonuclease 2 n=1 Tax=Cephalotus follicularis TaxID=3775 RepID=A0A1Q3CVM4_CEPFO|nr:RNB domain-containing protein [Cephalotus follicularis]
MMRTVVDQSGVERVDDCDKDKKKRRRSNRRSKANSISVPVSEIQGESSQSVGSGSKPKNLTSSMTNLSQKQHELEMLSSNDHRLTRASEASFNSMSTMHVNEQEKLVEGQNIQNAETFSNSCHEPIAQEGFKLIEVYAKPKIFAPYWSTEAVNQALEKGDVFKALFRANAHNRFEAYCKVDGVKTDILINGLAEQNRAVEGDVVVIKVDPLSMWTKMKGSAAVFNNSACAENCNLLPEAEEFSGDSCKAKSKLDPNYDYGQNGGDLLPENSITFVGGPFTTNITHLDLSGPENCKYVNGDHPSASDSSHAGCSSGQNELLNAVEMVSAMVSKFPSKRPTGKVVAIIERSPRRDAIVGFLYASQWFNHREGHKKEVQKNRSSLSISDHEYIQLIPNDSKFPKMVVLVRDLPDCIKKRLEDGDTTIEKELVSARIDNWGEDNPFPQARVLHIFGRGGEVEPQINAILYENAICCSEFSPESLSCIPHVPWEVPLEEFQSRKDLRNLCIFTIDPSSATDLDDALSVERLSNGIFRVGVHIADASYFVLPDSALDKEAEIRSTCVYMLKRKLPMLPPVLSENVASLNPGVDRLAFSIFWDFTGSGDVMDRWIGRTVVQSCCKLSYEHAQDIIDGRMDAEGSSTIGNDCLQLYGRFEWPDLIRSVKNLYEISKHLKEKRFNSGAIALENSKVFLLFDEDGIPYDSMFHERRNSNLLVEEFMLLANRTAAEVVTRAFPDSALLRRHPEPNMRKLKEFEGFCYKHGLELDTSSSRQFHLSLQQMKEKLKNDSILFDILISYATRPMQLASYFCSGESQNNANDWGHYALAVPLYTHFTSPLRRYPDIIVHRTLAAALEAEESYLKQKTMQKANPGKEVTRRCFTGIRFDKGAAASLEGREALSAAALKHGVPCTELLAEVAAYCNERKLASRHVKDACDKLYMWILLKNKEILLSEARVLGLGPRFMSIYIHKLAIEKRIYYDEVAGLIVEWLEATSTLVLSLYEYKRQLRKGGLGHYRPLEDVALVVNPYNLGELGESVDECTARAQMGDAAGIAGQDLEAISKTEICPAVSPLTVHLLSTIPVALHAVGGDDGPLEIGVRLYMSSYFSNSCFGSGR